LARDEVFDALRGCAPLWWSAVELVAEVLHPVGMRLRDQLILRTAELVDRRERHVGEVRQLAHRDRVVPLPGELPGRVDHPLVPGIVAAIVSAHRTAPS